LIDSGLAEVEGSIIGGDEDKAEAEFQTPRRYLERGMTKGATKRSRATKKKI
jgi:hypothetical protein